MSLPKDLTSGTYYHETDIKSAQDILKNGFRCSFFQPCYFAFTDYDCYRKAQSGFGVILKVQLNTSHFNTSTTRNFFINSVWRFRSGTILHREDDEQIYMESREAVVYNNQHIKSVEVHKTTPTFFYLEQEQSENGKQTNDSIGETN